jgi:purine-binding chemotaxis protein CheW
MKEAEAPSARVIELRAQFDRTFAARPVLGSEKLVDLLVIRVAGVAYALRSLEIGQVLAHPRITLVPSPVAELAGLCAVRGSVVPVYDLAALLGHTVLSALRYVALVSSADGETIGLGFEGLEEQLRVREDEIAQPPVASASAPHRYALIARDDMRPVLQIASVLDAIERRLR